MDPLSALEPARASALRGIPGFDGMLNAANVRPEGPADLSRINLDPALREIGASEPGKAFDSYLGRLISDVNEKQLAAGDAVNGLLSGEDIPLHRVMIATEEASVSFQLLVEVRNKLLEAYQELMRMQV